MQRRGHAYDENMLSSKLGFRGFQCAIAKHFRSMPFASRATAGWGVVKQAHRSVGPRAFGACYNWDIRPAPSHVQVWQINLVLPLSSTTFLQIKRWAYCVFLSRWGFLGKRQLLLWHQTSCTFDSRRGRKNEGNRQSMRWLTCHIDCLQIYCNHLGLRKSFNA